MQKKPIDIIGVPMDYGGNRRGVDMGPSAIRYSGLEAQLTRLGIQFRDLGNINVPIPETKPEAKKNGLQHLDAVLNVNAELFDLVLRAHLAGHMPVVLGGDHSIAVGSALATRDHYDRIGIIWIDAHADFNTAATTLSGNLHGMPLSSITGVETDTLAAFLPDGASYIDPKKAVVIGARSLDAAEIQLLKSSGVTVFTMQHIDLNGMRETVKDAIEIAGTNTSGFHVSFDMDAVSPKEAPGVGTPVKGGLTYREAHLACEMLYASGQILSLDVVELNPITDLGNVTGELAVSLILSALGKNIF